MIFNSYSEEKSVTDGITIVSCGHIFAKPNREIFRPKGRNDWLLFYVSKGSETFYFEKQQIAPMGSFVLFAPGEKQHHIYKGDVTAEFYFVHFRCDALPDGISLKSSVVYSLNPQSHYSDAFEEIIDETLKKRPFYERVSAYRLLSLLTVFERDLLFENSPYKENFHRIARVVQDMNINYNSNATLADYAKMCNISKYHFLRLVEEIVGETPLQYRNRIRLEHTAELLRMSYYSVEEISRLTGFSSPAYFSSAFKKRYAVSPKAYRK